MALEELDVIIDIVDSFSEEIDELLADLETVDVEAGRVEDLYIDVDVLGEREIAELESSLTAITDETVTLDVDTIGDEDVSNLKRQLTTLTDELVNVNVETLGEYEIAQLEAQLSSLTDKTVNIDANNLTADELVEIQTSLASVKNTTANIDADFEGREEVLEAISLKELAGTDVTADIDADVQTGDILEAIGLLTTMRALAAGDMDINSDMDIGAMFGGGGGMGEARGDIPEGGLLSLRMSDLHNAMAKLIPLVLVYVGALPAVIGGLLGLATAAVSAAAALGALTGLAGYGFALQAGDGDAMQGLQEITDRIQEDFADAFEPLARDLAPLFEDALDGLERFFDTLASHGDILRSLTDDARAFGAFMSEYIVGIATTMGTLADTASPLFALLGNVVEDLDLIEGFAGFLGEVLPSLVAFGSALAHIVTRLANLSVGFLQVATMATRFLDGLLYIVSGFGMFEETIGRAIASLLALTTILSILNSTVLINAISAVYELGYAYVAAAMSQLFAISTSTLLESTILSLTTSVLTLGAALITVTGGLWAIGMVAGAIAGQFMSTSSAIDDATESLEEFQNLQGDMDGTGGESSVVYQFAPTSQRTTINEQNVQDAYRTVKTKQFNDADIPS